MTDNNRRGEFGPASRKIAGEPGGRSTATRRAYSPPEITCYGSLVELTGTSNLPPPGDRFIPGSNSGT